MVNRVMSSSDGFLGSRRVHRATPFERHEHTVGVGLVVAKRTGGYKANAFIEPVGRVEGLRRAAGVRIDLISPCVGDSCLRAPHPSS